MRALLGGYKSLFREMLGLDNDSSFLSLPADLTVLIAIVALLGFLRNALSVWLHVLPGFYSFHFDILWVMISGPLHLFLFGAALLHWQLLRLGYANVRMDSILALSFHLQILHLFIPFLDWLGHRLGMPWSHVIGPQVVRTLWYTNDLYLTPGIIAGWWITGYLVARVLRGRMRIRWSAIIISSLISFLVIFIPVYVVFTALNTLFNRTFGLWFWRAEDYLYNSPSWFLQWGNGMYLAVTALIGLAYYLWQRGRGSLADR